MSDLLRNISRMWYRLRGTGSLVAVAALTPLPLAAAQVVYTVFPAPPPGARPAGGIAQPTGQAISVTLDASNSTIAYVVSALVDQSHLRVIFNDKEPAFNRRITVHIAHMHVLDALAMALHGTTLQAQLLSDGETIVIRERTGSALAARGVHAGVIAGRVTDSASGQGLGGVSVKVDGTKLATVTSDSGNFTLRDVPAGEQVVSAKLFGYRPAQRTVMVVDSQRTVVKIVMASVPTVLSGVVTTAAGTQRKVEVGNDITTLNVDSVMKVAPVMTVTDLLETRVPGLTVQHSSGAPGDPSRIRIRGASSIYGNNDPIVIVNGIRVYAAQSDPRNDNLAPSVLGRSTLNGLATSANGKDSTKNIGYAAPSPIDQIDPNSIETIEVLKGPSATAIYGADAANGVIVITTKHGQAGQTRWSVIAGAGINTEPFQWPINYYRFGYGEGSPGGSFFCQWNDQSCTQDSIVGFQALNDSRYTVFAKHGTDQSISATVSGGVPTLQYSLTGSGSGDVGLLKLPGIEAQRYEKFYNQEPPSWMQRPQQYVTWGGTGQVTAHPTSGINVTLSSSLFNSNQQNSSLEGAVAQLQGIYIDPFYLGSNPLVTGFVERATDHQLSSTNTLNVQWQATSWLPITATGGINTIQRTDETLIPYGINSQASTDVACLGSCGTDTTGAYGLGRGTSQQNTLSLRTNMPLASRVTLTVGGDVQSLSTTDFTAQTTQLAPGVTSPSVFPTTVTGGVGSPSTFGQNTSAGSTYGIYTQLGLRLPGNLFLNPGVRLDGGSAVGANGSSGALGLNGLTGLPKIDLSYVMVDQSHPRGPLTLLRPRIAFGRAETEPPPTNKLRLFSADTVVSLNGNTTYVNDVQLSTLGNSQLLPETSTELEGGFDAELWRGRVVLQWTHDTKTRQNAIVEVPVAPSVAGGVGYSGQQFINVGVIRDVSQEVSGTVFLVQNRAMSWMVGGNVSNLTNRVVRLNKGVSTIDLGNGTRVEAGYPLFGRWARPIAYYYDKNHDGIIEANEIWYGDSAVYVGSQDPKYQATVNTGFILLNGRLSVNATFLYTNGMTQFNDGAVQSGAFALLPNAPGTTLAEQAAVVAATGGGVTSQVGSGAATGSAPVTDIGVIQTVNTLRFDELSVNYTMPREMAAWFRVTQMVVSLQGKNLALRTNYRGADPNVNAFTTAAAGDQTEDLGEIPLPRTWWLKISLGN